MDPSGGIESKFASTPLRSIEKNTPKNFNLSFYRHLLSTPFFNGVKISLFIFIF